MKSDIEIISKFDLYIKKSLKNELRHRIRDMKRRKDRVICFSDLSESDEKKLFCVDQYPSDIFEEKIDAQIFDVIIRNELLFEALKSINPRARDIIFLKFWGDMTDKEIGKLLKMNRVSVTNSKNNALNKLRKIIEELKRNET